jgi:hypothetical protein
MSMMNWRQLSRGEKRKRRVGTRRVRTWRFWRTQKRLMKRHRQTKITQMKNRNRMTTKTS